MYDCLELCGTHNISLLTSIQRPIDRSTAPPPPHSPMILETQPYQSLSIVRRSRCAIDSQTYLNCLDEIQQPTNIDIIDTITATTTPRPILRKSPNCVLWPIGDDLARRNKNLANRNVFTQGRLLLTFGLANLDVKSIIIQ